MNEKTLKENILQTLEEIRFAAPEGVVYVQTITVGFGKTVTIAQIDFSKPK